MVDAGEELWALGERNELEPVREQWGRFVAGNLAHLLDLAVLLAEAEAMREFRAWVVDDRACAREAEALDVLGEPREELGANAATTVDRKDARRDEAVTSNVGSAGDA